MKNTWKVFQANNKEVFLINLSSQYEISLKILRNFTQQSKIKLNFNFFLSQLQIFSLKSLVFVLSLRFSFFCLLLQLFALFPSQFHIKPQFHQHDSPHISLALNETLTFCSIHDHVEVEIVMWRRKCQNYGKFCALNINREQRHCETDGICGGLLVNG